MLCQAAGATAMRRAPSQVWWAAAASPRSASLSAEELETLLNSRTSQREKSLGRSPRADSGAPQSDHAALQDRFYSVAEQYRPYETDIEKVSTAPQLSDLSHPATHAFVTALLAAKTHCRPLRWERPRQRTRRTPSTSWKCAGALRRVRARTRLSGFSSGRAHALRHAADLMRQASTTATRQPTLIAGPG